MRHCLAELHMFWGNSGKCFHTQVRTSYLASLAVISSGMDLSTKLCQSKDFQHSSYSFLLKFRDWATVAISIQMIMVCFSGCIGNTMFCYQWQSEMFAVLFGTDFSHVRFNQRKDVINGSSSNAFDFNSGGVSLNLDWCFVFFNSQYRQIQE